eukprot:TRINITY_DN16214_c0_g1_i2.p1 TRINITY_DN16214_c0_g1~~TRINITY_DN16214_c0_g1_i2.p1  ORF type:complete len:262 (+),score=33.87 TRINITY_DN16214_c0_g1_i2:189-974(+)
MSTADYLADLGLSSVGCSAGVMVFTIPQIVKLSSTPIQGAGLKMYSTVFARTLVPQALITAFQFSLVRKLKLGIDTMAGDHPMNLSFAYGIASVPLVAAKYNLLMEDVFHVANIDIADVPKKVPASSSRMKEALAFWNQRIAPGFMFSLVRDSGSIGGAIVLGPMIVSRVFQEGDTPSNLALFGCGMAAGSICGLLTQGLHNLALTAGQLQMRGEQGGHLATVRVLVKQYGVRALWLNYPMRVGAIASFSAILNVTQPFRE